MKRYIDATKSGCIVIYAKDEEGKPIEIVQAGTTIYLDDKSYRINSNRQNFEITLNDNNSFEIVISKLNDGTPFIMKNITTDNIRYGFGKFEDVDEYKSLLD